jgi:hypothetical protein
VPNLPPEPTAAPAPEPVAATPQRREVPRLDAKKSFTATKEADRWKQYIKEIPVLRARLVKAVGQLEEVANATADQAKTARENLAKGNAAIEAFEEATKEISERFASWEKEQTGPDQKTSQEKVDERPAAPADASGSSGEGAPGVSATNATGADKAPDSRTDGKRRGGER